MSCLEPINDDLVIFNCGHKFCHMKCYKDFKIKTCPLCRGKIDKKKITTEEKLIYPSQSVLELIICLSVLLIAKLL